MTYHVNHEQYFNQLRKNIEFGLQIMKQKNHDYAGDADPFKNFRAAEALGMSVEEGILVRMSDKLARAANLIKMKANDDQEGRDVRVKDESIEDTLIDLMNYSNILATYLTLRKCETDKNRQPWMGDEINDDGSNAVKLVQCCEKNPLKKS